MTMGLERPSDFPQDAFRALLQASPKQRAILHRYMECSDKRQSVVHSKFSSSQEDAFENGGCIERFTNRIMARPLESGNKLPYPIETRGTEIAVNATAKDMKAFFMFNLVNFQQPNGGAG